MLAWVVVVLAWVVVVLAYPTMGDRRGLTRRQEDATISSNWMSVLQDSWDTTTTAIIALTILTIILALILITMATRLLRCIYRKVVRGKEREEGRGGRGEEERVYSIYGEREMEGGEKRVTHLSLTINISCSCHDPGGCRGSEGWGRRGGKEGGVGEEVANRLMALLNSKMSEECKTSW